MAGYIEPLARLVNALSKLPGVGSRSAQRLAYHILERPQEEVRELAEAIYKAKKDIHLCESCGDYTAGERCAICADPRRDPTMLCVVRDPRDVAAIERSGSYKGRYHVLHGTISPSDNRGPDDIRIKELLLRLRGDNEIEEIIIATNPDLEGEATALYLSRLLKPAGLKVTRPAQGVQVGADIEYADEVTLSRAFEGRQLL